MSPYTHTQMGYVVIAMGVSLLLIFMYLTQSYSESEQWFRFWVMGCVTVVCFSFSTLTTVVDATHVRMRMGWGVIRKTFPLNDIESVQAVRNPWYYGWGYHVEVWPRLLFVFNVSGFDAVEITMKNGRLYRIGTDVPQELEREIRVRMEERQ